MRPTRPILCALALCAAAPAAAQGAAPIAAAGSQAGALEPGDASAWSIAIATGMGGRFGGADRPDREDAGMLVYIGAQADGAWPDAHGQAARVRLRLLTGADGQVHVPSDGDLEAAYLIGRSALRLVLGRVEVARHPGLGLEVLAQAATLPSVDGSLPLLQGTMLLSYAFAPVEAAWVRYHGEAHVPHRAGWATESDHPVAATAGRVRWAALLPAAEVSLQGDVVKLWRADDLLLSVEGTLGRQVLDGSAMLGVGLRWDNYTRRGLLPRTSETDSQVLAFATATLVL